MSLSTGCECTAALARRARARTRRRAAPPGVAPQQGIRHRRVCARRAARLSRALTIACHHGEVVIGWTALTGWVEGLMGSHPAATWLAVTALMIALASAAE